MKRLASLLPLVFFGLIACGGDSSPADGDGGPPNDGGPSGDGSSSSEGGRDGGASDAREAGACVTAPKVGDTCTPAQVSCDRVDPCCAQTIVCDPSSGKWKESGIACVQCEGFKCGDKTCQGGEVCQARASGVDGGTTSYQCVSMPAACARDWSCGCVTNSPPPGCTLSPANACSADGIHVTLSCMGA